MLTDSARETYMSAAGAAAPAYVSGRIYALFRRGGAHALPFSARAAREKLACRLAVAAGRACRPA